MVSNRINKLNIINPKQKIGSKNYYPYYAGFSPEFASSIIESSQLSKEHQIADPWNGSGTTTMIGSYLGYKSFGFDLNPVMIIAAKANMLSYKEYSSLWPLTLDITAKANAETTEIGVTDDPLC